MTGGYDYGRAGMIGIATPQANPTVEAEMRILLPPAAAMAVTRLTSDAAAPLARLGAYLEGLETALVHYDQLRLDALGFACTGSSYLTVPDREAVIVARAEDRFGYPIFTAAAAIGWYLQRSGARRIAIASPYPPALADAAASYWRNAGFELVEIERIATGSPDTRSIYGLGTADARPAVDRLLQLPVDAVLLTGTGMPSLRLLAEATGSPALISSNLCLAARLCAAIHIAEPTPESWRQRLLEASPPSEGTPAR